MIHEACVTHESKPQTIHTSFHNLPHSYFPSTDEDLFQACNIVLPCWIMLALLPGNKFTQVRRKSFQLNWQLHAIGGGIRKRVTYYCLPGQCVWEMYCPRMGAPPFVPSQQQPTQGAFVM